jgi:hypothetical protein
VGGCPFGGVVPRLVSLTVILLDFAARGGGAGYRFGQDLVVVVG